MRDELLAEISLDKEGLDDGGLVEGERSAVDEELVKVEFGFRGRRCGDNPFSSREGERRSS